MAASHRQRSHNYSRQPMKVSRASFLALALLATGAVAATSGAADRDAGRRLRRTRRRGRGRDGGREGRRSRSSRSRRSRGRAKPGKWATDAARGRRRSGPWGGGTDHPTLFPTVAPTATPTTSPTSGKASPWHGGWHGQSGGSASCDGKAGKSGAEKGHAKDGKGCVHYYYDDDEDWDSSSSGRSQSKSSKSEPSYGDWSPSSGKASKSDSKSSRSSGSSNDRDVGPRPVPVPAPPDEDLCEAACDGNACAYHAFVDLHAAEFGRYAFDECGPAPAPVLVLDLGRTYRFVQRHVSNHQHPLAFSYSPDAGDGLQEGWRTYEDAEGEVGARDYARAFGRPVGEWVGSQEYAVRVALPENYRGPSDLFYFGFHHDYLGGRIRLRRDGELLPSRGRAPALPSPPPPSDYDRECGTYGLVTSEGDDYWPHSMLADHRLPHPECPHTFVCSEEKSKFATCLNTINCHMFNGMTTRERHGEVGLFLHQMIPHHQNAVNMAKSLLRHWEYKCAPEELRPGRNTRPQCVMENVLRSIVGSQNRQIQAMRELLARRGIPEFDDCAVPVHGSAEAVGRASAYAGGSWYGREDDGQEDQERGIRDERGGGSSSENTKTKAAKKKKKRKKRKKEDHRGLASGVGDDGICRASCPDEDDGAACTFTVGVNLSASDLGAFWFEECGRDEPYPTLGIEAGRSYVFVQGGRSNYFHPLGFAYGPDGLHSDKLMVERKYLKYSVDEEDLGLSEYYARFFHSPAEWASYGTFKVELNYSDDYDRDLFYFCNIHKFMSGRIKLLENDRPVQPANIPSIPYSHPTPSAYDESCGTYGLAPFQLPHPECPSEFVCGRRSHFGDCIDAMNCHMMVGMTTHADAGNDGDVTLFCHQMIPHHENAVNMAKALLKTNILDCPRLTDEDRNVDCKLENILREIVNGQNRQIQLMYGVLEGMNSAQTNDCVVHIE